jgi:carboxymethylenebutenolidase
MFYYLLYYLFRILIYYTCFAFAFENNSFIEGSILRKVCIEGCMYQLSPLFKSFPSTWVTRGDLQSVSVIDLVNVVGMKTMEVSVSEEQGGDKGVGKKPFFRKRKYICSDSKGGCCGCCAAWPTAIILFMVLLAWAQTFPATKFTNVKYDVKGVTLHAYLATPDVPKNNTPAVMVFHAWNGISEEVTYFADQLAKEGYYAIAPDLFRGVAAKAMNILWNILAVSTTSQTQMDSDADAALAYLTAIPNVDENRVSSGPGFCFGGTQSLVFASRHKMAATVTCYGTYIKELEDADTQAWGKMKSGGPILGIYGAEDTSPSPEMANKFRKALEKNGMAHNITIYNGVGHAFITPESHKDSSAMGYAAWKKIIRFLEGSLKTSASLSRRTLDTLKLAEPYVVPLRVSLYHKFACAFKCAKDHFTHTGHWHSKTKTAN